MRDVMCDVMYGVMCDVMCDVVRDVMCDVLCDQVLSKICILDKTSYHLQNKKLQCFFRYFSVNYKKCNFSQFSIYETSNN